MGTGLLPGGSGSEAVGRVASDLRLSDLSVAELQHSKPHTGVCVLTALILGRKSLA